MNPVHTLTVSVQRYTRIAASFVSGMSGKVSAVIFRRNSVAGYMPRVGVPFANGETFHANEGNAHSGTRVRRSSCNSKASNVANSPMIHSPPGSSLALESRRTLRPPSPLYPNGKSGSFGSSFFGRQRASVGESVIGPNGSGGASRSVFARRWSSGGSEWSEHDNEVDRERRMSSMNTVNIGNAVWTDRVSSSIDCPGEFTRQDSGSGILNRAGGHSTVMFESLPSPRKPQDMPINT